MKRLLTLKQSLATLENLDFDLSDDEEGPEDQEGLEEFADGEDDFDIMTDAEELWSSLRMQGLDADELQELLADASRDETATDDLMSAPKSSENEKSSRNATLVSHSAPMEKAGRPKKKRKVTEAKVVFDLVEPTFVPTSKSNNAFAISTADVYGESSSLQYADLADKKARKKSLQFYTAKVANTAAKRDNARATMGGDDDLPYKSRKEQRAKVNKRDRGQGGDDLDEETLAPKLSQKRARETEPEEDESGTDMNADPAGYYSLVKSKSHEKKEQKKAEYDDARMAERAELSGVNNEATGPRSLTRAILKNKGLTPTRSKSVRNPRVKKRQKFEKAKRKVSSQRAVYKGGLANSGGRYEGEKSGISKVVKSTRL
jgi:U3 small nucleolar RNA-associated protein 3